MSMGGLAVAIGLVIDDAVVVVENIHRRIAAGGGPNDVERATEELVAPVVSSTLTTVVVFAPLGLLSGVVGDFFKALSITLVGGRADLARARADADSDPRAHVVPAPGPAAVITTITCATTATRGTDIHAHEHVSAVERGVRAHAARPSWRGRSSWRSRLIALGVAAYVCYQRLGTGFFPAADEGGFVLDYWTPPGMALEDTDARMTKVEAILDGDAGGRVLRAAHRLRDGHVRHAAESRRHPRAAEAARRAAPRRPTRSSTSSATRSTKAVPDTEIEFAQLLQDMLGDLEGAPTPIEVKVFGDDQAKLRGAVGGDRREAREDPRHRRRRRPAARRPGSGVAGRSASSPAASA